ncbi:DUF1330 domain-containing protein [Halioglobus japonicus]|uniref:DUF1330 domain-containing protein n=1 Tax=Halioglobus japonicus TaxID=930805 RepID=A0AAP8MGX7_9GAMM|nr:DUF1330 domain-containing protein [Halioglobus japonicus]AQA19277.1 DUF1330 domain-containing protein [Halioglobus japonicus]PLW87685.1 DUF1330 domain-containing protein [Halioglobus japonicus]GHD07113.1 DUF1330 domain-containing protein [Halioglobus japonicus]
MEVNNRVYPNGEQIQGFLEPGPDGAICMVNLLKFKPQAEYEDGRESDLTGREAYEIYEAGVTKILEKVGGSIGFFGEVERLTMGEVEELWDTVALAVWPSRKVMFEVMQSEDMQAIAVHRAAGLAGQLNIETRDLAGSWIA